MNTGRDVKAIINIDIDLETLSENDVDLEFIVDIASPNTVATYTFEILSINMILYTNSSG